MTASKRHNHHQYNIPGHHLHTADEIEGILDAALEEAGVEVNYNAGEQLPPHAEIIDFGVRLSEVRRSELEAA